MPYFLFLWTSDNEGHIGEHGVTAEEFEEIVQNPDRVERSRSSDRTIALGEVDGRFLACVYEKLDDATILPIPAYEV